MSQTDDQASSLRTIITRGIRSSLGLHEQFASQAASAVYDEIQKHYAGELVYIRRAGADRKKEILKDFSGNNHNEVCEKHGISKRTLQRYIKSSYKASK